MSADPPVVDTVRGHVWAELRLMGRAFAFGGGATALLFGVVYALVVALAEAEPGAPSKALVVPVAFGYGLFVGLVPGAVIGGLRVSWVLVGAWTLLPLVLVPGALVVALWAASDVVAELARGVGEAAMRVGAEREWVSASIGKAAHAGPIVVLVLAPLLLVDLGAIALDPAVLWAVFVLVAALGGVCALAVVPAGLVSMVVLLPVYVGRLRRRIAGRREATGDTALTGTRR